MLRRKVGDSLFWKSIQTYYATYKGKNANSDDLRKVFEDVTNTDLNNFFKQWIYTAGQPDLAITWSYSKKKKQINLTVTQKQENIFEFPLDIKIDDSIKTINITEKITKFSFALNAEPASLIFDPNTNLLFTYTLNKVK
jgi:aminopeptidase N